MRCYSCQGTGRHHTGGLSGRPVPCRFCNETGTRNPCVTFDAGTPPSTPHPLQPCQECGHRRYAHPNVVVLNRLPAQ